MASSRDKDELWASGEDRVNAMRGYKAAIHNPRVSDEAKAHAQDVLDNELGGDKPRHDLYAVRGDPQKDPMRIAAGYKAATKNPRNSEEGKQRASDRLDEMENR
ncbi:hypothetical protein ASPZODRAFT_15996 [Penicilliopsis zonata CBS 506.65]|uniref:Conidiation protein 6 n=1 Tax=Penicilliopsis zonata CBS 506.65 TaxID=1073090 RepID=A0A1L9SJT3_9EURO|nr:hypothetical protein ASPZODRAFT_15996 [Penicilliopsis zonata CBS 506.65]OJJ47314.1 hypothetical protein ASPZODRAFT_15996 [Penicilliopsis zonata CBS 506.65]